MLGDKIGEVFSQKEESNVSSREINETKKTISDDSFLKSVLSKIFYLQGNTEIFEVLYIFFNS